MVTLQVQSAVPPKYDCIDPYPTDSTLGGLLTTILSVDFLAQKADVEITESASLRRQRVKVNVPCHEWIRQRFCLTSPQQLSQGHIKGRR